MTHPYWPKKAPHLPNPERPAYIVAVRAMRPSNVISSRCIGYQIEDGVIKRSVWSGAILFDDGKTRIQYWTEGGGCRVFRDTSPRVDRPMPDRPVGEVNTQ